MRNRLVPNEWPWPSFRGRLKSREPLCYIRHWISRKSLEIEAWLQEGTIGNGPQEIEWSRDWWRQVTPKGRTRNPTLRVQYLENSWICYFATIANYCIVCCEAVQSAILATAWLLVLVSRKKTWFRHRTTATRYPTTPGRFSSHLTRWISQTLSLWHES